MDPQQFLEQLDVQLQAFGAAEVEAPRLMPDHGNLVKWGTPTSNNRALQVGVADKWLVLRRYLAKSNESEQAFLLVSGPASSPEKVRHQMRLMLRSANTVDGVVVAEPFLKKQSRPNFIAALGAAEFPKYSNNQLTIGPLDENFLPRLLQAVTALEAVRALEPEDGVQKVSPGTRRFWAGSIGSRGSTVLQQFIAQHRWELGDIPASDEAQRCKALFSQMRENDWFAIKSYAGPKQLRLLSIGRLTAIDRTNFSVTFEPALRPGYEGPPPPAAAGKWHERLNEISASELISTLFGEDLSPHSASPRPAHPLNTILYGPPGTGKTYQSIARAVEIVDGPAAGEREAIQRRFKALCNDGRIAFITFHQSYSYEDFLEGIRPVMSEDDERGARYELADGIFKRIAIEATAECLERIGGGVALDFDARWEALIAMIENEPEKRYPGLTSASEFEFWVTPRGHIDGKNVHSGAVLHCPKSYLEKVFNAYPQQGTVGTAEVYRAAGTGCHASVIAVVFRELQKMRPAPKAVAEVVTAESEIVERFLERGEASGYRLKPPGAAKPYVLLIDEINRGNISKIFGELITLLEPDKRLGAPVEIVAKLPYSQKNFALPPNLYVLGTMNTADKSLALLDLALRRRFEFEELQADFSAETCPCPNLPDELRAVLEQLNHRIALRKDRDHLIGHAFFATVTSDAEFNRVFERRVIPLLQEYFFNDWEGLRAVLGEESSGSRKGFIRPLESNKSAWARNQWRWYHDDGGKIDCHAVLRANYRLSPPAEHAPAPDHSND